MLLTCLSSKYLSDPNEEVRTATKNLLAGFLKEMRDIAMVQKRADERARLAKETDQSEQGRRYDADREKLPDITMSHPERAAFLPEDDGLMSSYDESVPDTEIKDVGGIVYFLHFYGKPH